MTADHCELLCLDLPKAETARRRLPAAEALATAAMRARALADPTRLLVAVGLREAGESCVCDLAWVCGRSEKLVSHHARALRAAGLVASRRDGKMVMYELTAAGAALLASVVAEIEAVPA